MMLATGIEKMHSNDRDLALTFDRNHGWRNDGLVGSQDSEMGFATLGTDSRTVENSVFHVVKS